MPYKSIILLFLFSINPFITKGQEPLHKGFVYLEDVIPNILYDLKYHSEDNFLGECVDGYQNERVIITQKAADHLIKIQKELNAKGLTLYIYDTYRPQKAVNHFVRWAKNLNDTINKAKFYPNVPKKRLFADGYISSHSRHSSGSTIDLTLATLDGQILDMGSPYDFFGPESHVNFQDLTKIQNKNRAFLQSIMIRYGFRNYSQEWWHFTLKGEPFRNKYFNFDVN